MTSNKYILVSLEDEKAKKIAEILSNKTAKKILDFLADKNEASETDIAQELGIPLNTAEYNIKKLLEADLIGKAKNFFWSVRGKKIDMYKLARKHIVISSAGSKPSMSKLKSILPVALISGAFALIVRYIFQSRVQEFYVPETDFVMKAAESAGIAGVQVTEATNIVSAAWPIWLWFLIGAGAAIIIFTILNWRKL